MAAQAPKPGVGRWRTNVDSLRGHFLVASPHLPDPNFFRTVVLMVRHDESGALGLVMNRYSRRTVKEIWEQIDEGPCQSDLVIQLGGPIVGPLMAVHTDASMAEDQIADGVFFATHKDFLCKLVAKANAPFRIFSGYAGWGSGQLENELRLGGWLMTPASKTDIFDLPDDVDLWKKVTGRIGGQILGSALDISRFPDDPSAN